MAGDTVQITGISRHVNSGEWLLEVKNETEAVEVVNYRKRRRERLAAIQRKKAGDVAPEASEASEVPEGMEDAEAETEKVVHIPLVVKADEDGSLLVEARQDSDV